MSPNRLGPFQRGTNPHTGEPMGVVSTDDRRQMVRGFTREQCEEALQLPGLQRTVRQAVERRLRLLQREKERA